VGFSVDRMVLFLVRSNRDGSWPPPSKTQNGDISAMGQPIYVMFISILEYGFRGRRGVSCASTSV